MLLISPEINVVLLLDVMVLCFLSVGVVIGFQIARKWDMAATTPLQYRLEKRNYLTSTIIKYVFFIKIISFPYFVMSMDQLSAKIPGAMCATGVFSASVYGHYLLGVKVIALFYFGLWLTIHHFDTRHEDCPYTKGKYKLLLLIGPIFLLEIFLELLMLKDIDPGKIVSCCGTLFGGSSVDSVSQLLTEPNVTMILFYISMTVLLLVYFIRLPFLYLIMSTAILFTAIVSLIYFFSSYVYELPVHKCPFCLIQADYLYMGYGLYLLLFGGAFAGIYYGLLNYMIEDTVVGLKRISILLLLLYTAVVTYYPLAYFIQNGVWLW